MWNTYSSRRVPAVAVLKCYDWAIAWREAGRCIISGFHSQMKKDVLHYLPQPIILALTRGLKQKLETELQPPLEQGRLLIITPFDNSVKWVTAANAAIRNQMMINLADEIVVGYSSPRGQLDGLLANYKESEIIRL
ncbi:MAG: hypothetical protein PHE26_04515 [Syntrophomonadaceae bacterium]|nr:hypothetical protein [Syntrophomonadaceae bacterium]